MHVDKDRIYVIRFSDDGINFMKWYITNINDKIRTTYQSLTHLYEVEEEDEELTTSFDTLNTLYEYHGFNKQTTTVYKLT